MSLFLLSFILVYLSFPIVKKLEAKGVRREVSTLVLFLILSLLGLVLFLAVIPSVYSSFKGFLESFPFYLNAALPTIVEKINIILSQLNVNFQISTDQLSFQINEFIRTQISHISGDQVQNISFWFGKIMTNFLGVFIAIIKLFLVPIFFFFVILDYEKLSLFLVSLVPPRHLQFLKRYLTQVNRILSGFLFGQTTVILILSLLYGVGLSLTGLDYGFLVGILTGCLYFLPYVGATLGFSISVILSLSHGGGDYTQLIFVILIYMSLQVLEGFVITPRIVGNRVGLKPLETLLSLILFGNFFGFLGMLLAIPLGGIFKMTFLEFVSGYRTTRFYNRN